MKFPLLAGIIFLLTACRSHDKNTNEQYFISMKDCPFKISVIDSGASIRIIGFSGGRESDKQTIYYDQFVGVTDGGDTLRILTPLINTSAANTYSSPLLYNHDKGIETATIQPSNEELNKALGYFIHSKELEQIKDGGDLDKLSNDLPADRQLVMVKGIRLFESTNFKTVIGALHFDEVPW